MEAVFGLLVMLLGVSHGVETHCDGRQYAAQCYGPLGGTVVLQLMDEASQIPKYEWKKESTIILRWRQNEIITNSLKDRSVFTPSNGTFRINKLSRTDSSEYTLSIFDLEAKLTSKKTLHLSIQAPVSSVLMVSECLSQGEMKVSCSSEGGDSPQYSWTLGGRALTDAELYSENKEENSITLKQHVSGRVACKVWNHVSSVSKEEDIMNCGFIYINCISDGTEISQWVFAANNTLCIQSTTVTSDHSLLVHGLLVAVLFLLFIGIHIFFACKKKKLKALLSHKRQTSQRTRF
ncbi:T-cell surface antigen CD2-like isoform X2 [Embiotoca jacksoni]|uniref:T-cell surface antigen CD2-like isoform X2 n=1 Tax=Embiotoca jacksoni TaxID=100190 RepID=UPI003704020D